MIAARSRVRPADVGLPATDTRRVPGLRREEVARLAGISVAYVIGLEQGRRLRPSVQVLAALARALRLDDAETDHLFALAGAARPAPGRLDRVVRARTARLLDQLAGTPAVVCDPIGTIIAWNELALALLGDLSEARLETRNVLRWRFLEAGRRRIVYDTPAEEERSAVEMVADLREAVARYPDDPDVARLLTDLSDGSARFRRIWADAPFEVERSSTKLVDHPDVGRLRLDCDVLHLVESDQRLVVYTAEPGTPAAEAIRLLAVIGTQSMEVGP